MGFGSISHWLIVLLILMIFFGGSRISELGRGLGKGIKAFKEELDGDDTNKTKKDEELPNKTEIKKDEEQNA